MGVLAGIVYAIQTVQVNNAIALLVAGQQLQLTYFESFSAVVLSLPLHNDIEVLQLVTHCLSCCPPALSLEQHSRYF